MRQEFRNIKTDAVLTNGFKHDNKSERYQALSAQDLINTMADSGLTLVHKKVGQGRRADLKAYQTATLRFSSDIGIGDSKLDIIVKNANYYGSIKMYLGLYRGICSNQLAVGKAFESVSIGHVGDVYSKTGDAIEQLLSKRAELTEQVYLMKNTVLSAEQQHELFKQLLALRLNATEFAGIYTTQDETQFQVAAVASPYRAEDASSTLWNCFNLNQERIIRGDVVLTDLEASKSIKLRRLKNIDNSTVELNQHMWDTASKLLVA